MIDELMVQRIKYFDRLFKTRSKVFPLANIIIVETPLEQWEIEITDCIYKKYCLYHKNRNSRKNKHHLQAQKRSLYDTYDSIYKHNNVLRRPKRFTYKRIVTNAK